MKSERGRYLVTALVLLIGVALIGAAAFVLWANDAAQPTTEALAALKTDEFVTFQSKNGWLVFAPVNQGDAFGKPVDAGLIIYPGGKVDYRAYAPIARAIAEKGYLVVVPPMPLNLAFFDTNEAANIIAAFPNIKHWAMAGHSLGGVAAANYTAAHPEQIQGLGLWAAYPAGDMKGYPGRVVSISGTLDGLATAEKIEDSKKNLPLTTKYVPIEGGNHGQFGAYGAQSGDNAATISREEQQDAVAAAMAQLLQEIE